MRQDDDEAALAARVLDAEHRIYPLALKLVAEGRVRVENGRCLIDGVPVPDAGALDSLGLNLSHTSIVNIGADAVFMIVKRAAGQSGRNQTWE